MFGALVERSKRKISIHKELIFIDMNKATIKYDAHVKKDGSIILTNDLHQKGEMVLLKKIDITSEPWMMQAVVSMGHNMGISDEDGKGGDGIWFKFNDDNLVIGLDTFMN